MLETEHYKVAESLSQQETDQISLKTLNKETELFTGSKVIYALSNSGEKVAIKIPFDGSKTLYEWEGIIKAFKADVPIPKPIALINYLDDQLAIVSSFVAGDNLYFNPNPDIKTEIGKEVKKMHQKAQIEGKDWIKSKRNTFIYYDQFIFRWATGQFKELGSGSKTLLLLGKFTPSMESYCKTTIPVFNHNDLHDGQIIVDENGNPKIIDFGNWVEEGWLNELGYHLFHLVRTRRISTEDFPNFLDGYLSGRKLSEDEKSTLAFYLLFISARALNYFNSRNSSYLPFAQETHNGVLKLLDREIIWKKY